MEELAQKLEEEGIMRKIQKETKCGNNVGLQPNAINFCKKSERIPDSKVRPELNPEIVITL